MLAAGPALAPSGCSAPIYGVKWDLAAKACPEGSSKGDLQWPWHMGSRWPCRQLAAVTRMEEPEHLLFTLKSSSSISLNIF